MIHLDVWMKSNRDKRKYRLFKGIGCSGSYGKESACNAGDPSSIPWSRRSPGEGNGKPLQYSCLENSMDRGAWQATVHGVAKSQTQLSDDTSHFSCSCGRDGKVRGGNWLREGFVRNIQAKHSG